MKKKLYEISLMILILDRVTKLLVMNNLVLGERNPIINHFFSLTYTKNTGGAFSILSGNVPILIMVGMILGIGMIYTVQKNPPKNKIEVLAIGSVLGGLFGNLWDRIQYQGVIDFLDFKIFSYQYPIFNIADIAIVLGIIGIILLEIRGENHESK